MSDVMLYIALISGGLYLLLTILEKRLIAKKSKEVKKDVNNGTSNGTDNTSNDNK